MVEGRDVGLRGADGDDLGWGRVGFVRCGHNPILGRSLVASHEVVPQAGAGGGVRRAVHTVTCEIYAGVPTATSP